MFPEEFLDRLQAIIPADQLAGVVASFSQEKRTSFRANTILAKPDEVLAGLSALGIDVERIAWCDHAFQVAPSDREALTHSSFATQGQIYVQGLSSILASLILDPQPDEWNLDLAAAPGGKSTHIVALMNNQGKLSVVEPIRKRMYRLANNLKRLGSTISKTYLMDGRKAGQKVPERFDRVLLDSPCSGESRMRCDNPKSYEFWSQRKIKEQSRKQTGLIESAFTTLKPGGILLYSTCSFAPEENEAIVSHLLNQVGAKAEILTIEMPFENWQPGLTEFADLKLDSQVEKTRRILPNENFDGFYLARIRKRSDLD